MSDDLEPLSCPFCGVGVRAMSRYHPRDPNEWYVSCGAKDCMMQPETPTYRTEAEAIAAWNRRAPDAEIERLRTVLKEYPEKPSDGLNFDNLRGYFERVRAWRELRDAALAPKEIK